MKIIIVLFSYLYGSHQYVKHIVGQSMNQAALIKQLFWDRMVVMCFHRCKKHMEISWKNNLEQPEENVLLGEWPYDTSY